MDKFFSEFFSNEPTLFTLFGSKPMSEISLCTTPKVEWIESYEEMWKDRPDEEKKRLLARFKVFLEAYDLPILWEKWIAWSKKNLDKSFLFVKRKTEEKDLFSIYILNVQEAAFLLQKYYETIKKEINQEFDPLQVVLEFDDLDSVFWEKIFSNHYLQGILHGYGKRNAYLFHRQLQLQEINEFDVKTHPLFASTGISRDQYNDSRSIVSLPLFRSYYSGPQIDPVILKYEREQCEIKNYLKGKNLTNSILLRMGYNSARARNEIAFAQ